MKDIKIYIITLLALLALLALMGCAGSSGGGSNNGGNNGGGSYTLKYRLKETDTTYVNFNNDAIQSFTQNIEVKLEGDNFDLHTDEGKIAGKVLRVTSDKIIKISKKDVTTEFIKEYNIKIDKSSILANGELIQNIYFPILIEVFAVLGSPDYNDEIRENKSTFNKLESTVGNLLKIFIPSNKIPLLDRFKNIYFIDQNSNGFPNKNNSQIISDKSTSHLEAINSLTVEANLENKLGLKLYGLEHFNDEGENKINLISLGTMSTTTGELITTGRMPFFTFKNESRKKTISPSVLWEANFKPTFLDMGGLKGNLNISYLNSKNSQPGDVKQGPFNLMANSYELIKTYNLPPINDPSIEYIKVEATNTNSRKYTSIFKFPNTP